MNMHSKQRSKSLRDKYQIYFQPESQKLNRIDRPEQVSASNMERLYPQLDEIKNSAAVIQKLMSKK